MARDRASRPEAKPLRLFAAADIPDEVRGDLAAAIAPLRDRIRGKWVPTQNWHLTLKFLGSTWPRLVEWVHERCAEAASSVTPFETALTGLGAFRSPRRARVLWAGLDDPDGRFAAIAGALDEAMAGEFKIEKRTFTPHLTVARFEPEVDLTGELESIVVTSDAFPVDRIILYCSHLQRPAPRYEPVGEFPLGR